MSQTSSTLQVHLNKILRTLVYAIELYTCAQKGVNVRKRVSPFIFRIWHIAIIIVSSIKSPAINPVDNQFTGDQYCSRPILRDPGIIL